MDALSGPAALGFDPDWSIAPDVAAILLAEVKRVAPRTVVELGSGWSTVVLSAALSHDRRARLVSVDEDAGWLARTERVLTEQGLERACRLVHAPLRSVSLAAGDFEWYGLPQPLTDRPIDLLFIDGPSNAPEGGGQRRYPALPVFDEALARDAVVVVDDAHRDGEREMVRRWSSELGWDVEWLDAARGCAILHRPAISRAAAAR